MGKKTNRRGRLRRIAAALAAATTAIVPAAGRASVVDRPEAVAAKASGTAAPHLLELAQRHPEEVLANRELRRLRAQDPAAHRDIVLAARCARAENALTRTMARADAPTLRLFACDCAERVLPLCARFGPVGVLLEQGRASALAAAAEARERPRSKAAQPPAISAFETALRQAEREVDALEREVAAEATVTRGARSALGELAFARIEQHVADLEEELEGRAPAEGSEEPLRMLTVAMKAAEAIDQALLVAAGGSARRIDGMCEAIAEAIYLDNTLRGTGQAVALDAVFRELAWQRRHLRALVRGAV
jgi:hypothetical protein